jgi:hypothetical protein
MAYADNLRIYVRASGDGVSVIGQLEAATGLFVKFHGFPELGKLRITELENPYPGLVGATGNNNATHTYREYAKFCYIAESDAVVAGWPTGTGSYKFGHGDDTDL